MNTRSLALVGVVTLGFTLTSLPAAAQTPPAAPPASPNALAIAVEPSDEPALLTYFNRPILTLRADVLGRPPRERCELAIRSMDSAVAAHRTEPVEARTTEGGVLIGIGRHIIIGLTPADLDPATDQTLDDVAAETVRRLQLAFDEAVAARAPGVWIRGGLGALGALAAGVFVLWWLGRVRRTALERLVRYSEDMVARTGLADQSAARASQLLAFFERRSVAIALFLLRLAVLYVVVTFTLRRFPYTRPWGESLRGSVVAAVAVFSQAVVSALPSVMTVVAILAITRLITKLVEPWFDAIERGTITIPAIHPETATTTRRLITVVLWLLAIAIAYPFVPGSGTDVFKGFSVFVGLMVTLGSSGLVSQIMSGFMVTYSRALRLGDFVRIGEIEGTITHMGILSTKLKTPRSEEVTIPNAVVVGQTVLDYSRFSEAVLTTTAVTIGYDTPWRQVHALLLAAAERTPSIRRDPPPRVLQTALEDAAVKYVLCFCVEQQHLKLSTMTVLHGHIQDLFNEYGVQIMTPRYEADPATPKLVEKKDWFAAPARSEPRPAARNAP